MEITNNFYQMKLKEVLAYRQKVNTHYSLRAYARDLEMHPGTLAKVIKGERSLPIKNSKTVIQKLRLKPTEQTLFMESLLRKKTNIDKIQINSIDERHIVDESNYKVLAEWEHFIVIDLFDVKGFEKTVEDISKRLDISLIRAEVVVDNLMTSGLIKKNQHGKLQRVHKSLRTTEDIESGALQDAHTETLQMGINKLSEIEVELRDFSSEAMAIDLDQLLEAKTIIREFRQKMSSLLRDGKNKTDVYQLAIQFYPLTNMNNPGEKS